MFVQQIVNRLVGHFSGDGDGPTGTIARPAPVSGCGPPSVVKNETHRRSSFRTDFTEERKFLLHPNEGDP
jgi:hypothetical protein